MSALKIAVDAALQEKLLQFATNVVEKKATGHLFREGRKAQGCYLVLNGKLRLGIKTDRKTCLDRVVGSGCLVGLPATVNGVAYSLNCDVIEDAKLAFLSRSDLDRLMRADTTSAIKLLQLLSVEVQALRHQLARPVAQS